MNKKYSIIGRKLNGAVSSIVEDLKPYIGRITVYGDRCIPKMPGFTHTFRGMTRNIDFYDNAEFTAS